MQAPFDLATPSSMHTLKRRKTRGFGDSFGGLPRVEVNPHADWSMDGMRRLMGWGVGGRGWGGG